MQLSITLFRVQLVFVFVYIELTFVHFFLDLNLSLYLDIIALFNQLFS